MGWNHRLIRDRDGLTKESEKIMWVEWNEERRGWVETGRDKCISLIPSCMI